MPPNSILRDARAPPAADRPPCMVWSTRGQPKQVEVLALCHLLEAADGRAAPMLLHTPTKQKRSRAGSEAKSGGGADLPGPPLVALMIAAQSMRFACGACFLQTVPFSVHSEERFWEGDCSFEFHIECLHTVLFH